MSFLETQWWQLELPPEWSAQQDDEQIIVSDCDGVGEIVFTTLEKEEGVVSDEELLDFARELPSTAAAKALRLGSLQGYYYSFREDGDAVREWYLRDGQLLLLISYCCAEDNAGMDDAAVDEILDTLLLKTADDSAA